MVREEFEFNAASSRVSCFGTYSAIDTTSGQKYTMYNFATCLPKIAFFSVLDLHLDCALCRVRSDMERRNGLFQFESVRHQRLQVNKPASDKSNGLGILVGVSELQADIDLVG